MWDQIWGCTAHNEELIQLQIKWLWYWGCSKNELICEKDEGRMLEKANKLFPEMEKCEWE